ncbi:hypothetical protein QTV49_000456 [Vibrio vulnificus]|nr:hypothetical protein [Vibrio vulnificus]
MIIKKLIVGFLLTTSTTAFASYKDALFEAFDGVRVYHSDSEKVFGYAVEKGQPIGGYFSLSLKENNLIIGESKYTFNDGKLVKNTERKDRDFKNNVVPYFATRYGHKYSEGDNGAAYVFLDYSCQFSRAFVDRGELEILKNKGKEVWLMPISRDATTEGILNYSALTCSDSKPEAKVSRFLDWMSKGKAFVNKSELKAAKCHYWLDLKPYYGLVKELGFDGVPAVVEVN